MQLYRNVSLVCNSFCSIDIRVLTIGLIPLPTSPRNFVHKNCFWARLDFVLQSDYFFLFVSPCVLLAAVLPSLAFSACDVIGWSNCLSEEVVFKTDQHELNQLLSFGLYFFLSLCLSSFVSFFGVFCRILSHYSTHLNRSCSLFGNICTTLWLSLLFVWVRWIGKHKLLPLPFLNICLAGSGRHNQVTVVPFWLLYNKIRSKLHQWRQAEGVVSCWFWDTTLERPKSCVSVWVQTEAKPCLSFQSSQNHSAFSHGNSVKLAAAQCNDGNGCFPPHQPCTIPSASAAGSAHVLTQN